MRSTEDPVFRRCSLCFALLRSLRLLQFRLLSKITAARPSASNSPACVTRKAYCRLDSLDCRQCASTCSEPGRLIDVVACELHCTQRHEHSGRGVFAGLLRPAARHEPPSPVRRTRTGARLAAGCPAAADWMASGACLIRARRARRPTRRCVRAGTSRPVCGMRLRDGRCWAAGRWAGELARSRMGSDSCPFWPVASRRVAAPAACVSNSARTKFETTPMLTVTPIARSTGRLEVASRAKTMSVEREQTRMACSVRRCSDGSSAACSKNSA